MVFLQYIFYLRKRGDIMQNEEPTQKKKLNGTQITHIVFGIIMLVIITIGAIQLIRWNKGREFLIDENINVDTETEDYVFYMDPAIYDSENYDGQLDILILGNDTVAYDKDGSSIGDMIAEQTGATVYNCAFEGSYLSSVTNHWTKVLDHNPIDAYSFFWLNNGIFANNFDMQERALDMLPEGYDRQHYEETLNLLKSVDFNSIDLLLIYYDGHDYLAQRPINNPFDMFDVTTMEGSFTGTYERYPTTYPHMQHMFIAPTFCYVTHENGTKEGCDTANLGHGNLPTCLTTLQVQSQNYDVSYLDNYYGININTETGDKYLMADGITPTREGREMIANRISEYISARTNK